MKGKSIYNKKKHLFEHNINLKETTRFNSPATMYQIELILATAVSRTHLQNTEEKTVTFEFETHYSLCSKYLCCILLFYA